MSEEIKAEPDFLEKTLLEPMSKLEPQPLSEDQTEMVISIILADKQGKIVDMYEEFKKSIWVLRALEKRVEISLTVNIDKATQIMLIMLLDGNIGRCVMFLYYFQWWAKQNNERNITMDIVVQRIIPMGLPDMDELSLLWDAQKAKEGGNYIDLPAASESIQFDTK